MNGKILNLVFAAFLLLCTANAENPIVLFRNGKPVPNYTALVASLKEGDTICFSDEVPFTIKSILGGRAEGDGRVSLVVDIGNGEALRIARGVGQIPGAERGYTYEDFMKYFHTGYQDLKDGGVQIIRFIQSGFGAGKDTPEYTRVGKINIAFKLSDFIKNPDMPLPKGLTRPQVENAMADFFASTADFANIGDFRAEQVAWNLDAGEIGRFELFDWSTMHYRRMHGFTSGIYSPFDKVSKDIEPSLRAQIHAAISAARTKLGCGQSYRDVADQGPQPPLSSDPYSTR